MANFAYLFERFPAVTQTFCYREVGELHRTGGKPLIFSVRRPEVIPQDCPAELANAVHYFDDERTLRREIKNLRRNKQIGEKAEKQFAEGPQNDLQRVYEALWLGPRLQKAGIGHVHAHFAGIAARTAYWLKEFYDITFSFTAHANDIFCDDVSTAYPVSHIDLIREASLVVTVTDYSCEWLKARYSEWQDKFHRVYNGIDLSEFSQTSFPPGVPHIVSVGRCIEKKGFKDLIDACALLRDRGVEFRCSIIGDGPLEGMLRARVEEHGLIGKVEMAGAKPQEEVRAILARSHIFALACATEADGGMDNLPTVIMEAMAAGLPVVSTRLAGVPEMVKEGRTGLLVEEKDPASLAIALESFLAHPDQSRRFGAQGIAYARENFAVAVTAGSLNRLINNIPRPWFQRLYKAFKRRRAFAQ